EEDLQRLRCELDDRVAVDAAGPAALEILAFRAEHAQPQAALRFRVDDDVGDVGAFAADPLLDLTRPCMSVVKPARAVEAERQKGDEAVVGAQEPELARLLTGRVED